MGLDVKLFVQAVDKEGEQLFLYESDVTRYWEFYGILIGDAPWIQDRLLGLLSDEEWEYFKFYVPEEPEKDFGSLEMKEPKKMLDILRKIYTHFKEQELKKAFKSDLSEGEDNWMLSMTRSKTEILKELGKLEGVFELIHLLECRIRTMIWVY